MASLSQLREMLAAASESAAAAQKAADAASVASGRAGALFDMVAAAEESAVNADAAAEAHAAGAESATGDEVRRLYAEVHAERARNIALEAEIESLKS